MKHVYTVEIKRAMYTDEAYEVYSAYQRNVHKSKSESKTGFKRFLCQVPLFDPKDMQAEDEEAKEERTKSGSCRVITSKT